MVLSGTPASSTTKTGRHDIAEILLKVVVALNTIKIIPSECCIYRTWSSGWNFFLVWVQKFYDCKWPSLHLFYYNQSSRWAPVFWPKSCKILLGPVNFSVFILNYIKINSRIVFEPVNLFWGLRTVQLNIIYYRNGFFCILYPCFATYIQLVDFPMLISL